MSHRTTIVLDDESLAAAREVSRKLGCSMSEVVRRALLRYRDLASGVPPELRTERVRTLRRLFELFEGHDPSEEIARLKAEDRGF
jgi:antitoxin component of RelBE/YafQ-DinJ toxin-antitoxin module